MMTCACGDPALEMWWLEWLPWALIHGHNPLYTNALYAGTGGVNALANAGPGRRGRTWYRCTPERYRHELLKSSFELK